MSDETETDVKQSVEAVAQAEEPEQVPAAEESSQTQEQQAQKPNDQEYNWKRARQQLEELQHENRLLNQRINELAQPKKPSVEQEIDAIEKELSQLSKDDLPTVEQVERLMYLREKKSDLKLQQLEKRFQEREQASLDAQVKSSYPDFMDVVNEENLNELKKDPLVVKALRGIENAYDQASFLYEQIKLRGLGKSHAQEKQQLERNLSKPRSTNSIGGASPLHAANDFAAWPNKELKSKLYQEMLEASKGY